MTHVFFGEPYKAVKTNACQILEQCIELLERLRRENYPSGKSLLHPVFFECETKFARVVLHDNRTNKRPGGIFIFIFFRASVGVKVGEKIQKT